MTTKTYLVCIQKELRSRVVVRIIYSQLPQITAFYTKSHDVGNLSEM